MWTSFGRTPEYKVVVHQEVFALCYNSNGGITHADAYHMPIWMRHFYLKQLTDNKQSEIRRQEEAVKKDGSLGPTRRVKAGPQ